MNEIKATTYLKLPFMFDEGKLFQDLSTITESKWIPHFNTSDYEGDWKVIPLYSDEGSETNIFAMPLSDPSIQETPILKKCPYLKQVIDSFKFQILTARILKLGAGAEIKPHRDHKLGYEDHSFRLHIPITTNKDVQFILDGTTLTMMPGECWYTNVNYVHSVRNQGTTDRVHLVIDGKRNDWTDQLFFSLAPEESFQPIPKKEESPETIKRIIEELKARNLPASEQLIKDLEEKLQDIDNKR